MHRFILRLTLVFTALALSGCSAETTGYETEDDAGVNDVEQSDDVSDSDADGDNGNDVEHCDFDDPVETSTTCGVNDAGVIIEKCRDGELVEKCNAVKALSAGTSHTCAVLRDQTLYCWGRNYFGQVGDGTQEDQLTPVQLDLESVVDVAAGSHHSCALTEESDIYCWGSSADGKLGGDQDFEEPEEITEPEPVTGLGDHTIDRLVEIPMNHTCAVTTDDELICWGSNSWGQLGLSPDDVPRTNEPTVVSQVSPLRDAATGTFGNCVVDESQTLRCWGVNSHGSLGIGEEPQSTTTPTVVSGVGDVRQVSAGTHHVCIINDDDAVYCWGDSLSGQVGNGVSFSNPDPDGPEGNDWVVFEPAQLTDLEPIRDIFSARGHTCALTFDDQGYCWGGNAEGAFGNGDDTTQIVPTAVDWPQTFYTLSGGNGHTCGISYEGYVYCWGSNGYNDDIYGSVGSGSTDLAVLEPEEVAF